jgi:NAD(P)-dependent dehydrogenase (short-subunit alcohol dehydrogenase family)
MTLKVFITGASSGIGEALAVYYAGQGARLGIAGRRSDALAELDRRLGGGHACYPLDVTDASALHAAATDFIARFGTPDIVIASAGVSAGTLTECEEDLGAFRRIMDINVFGMAATFAPFIPAMKAAGGQGRRLVGIASVAGIRGLPGAEAYSASKAAAIAYLESLRLEMRPAGIKVVTIAPGYIETPMTAINPYRMPFLMPAARAAECFGAAIARGTSYTVIPWQMGVVAKLLRLLPNPLYDLLFANAPRKPRGLKA